MSGYVDDDDRTSAQIDADAKAQAEWLKRFNQKALWTGEAMTPEDRELLQMAAKAAGLRVWESCGQLFVDPPPNDGKVSGVSWNPLEDDESALRLAVKCTIEMIPGGGICFARPTSLPFAFGDAYGFGERSGSDACAAMRRAIVRAAAAIGRSMP
jgi:hypothetical protein